jgi:hypothetical protein
MTGCSSGTGRLSRGRAWQPPFPNSGTGEGLLLIELARVVPHALPETAPATDHVVSGRHEEQGPTPAGGRRATRRSSRPGSSTIRPVPGRWPRRRWWVASCGPRAESSAGAGVRRRRGPGRAAGVTAERRARVVRLGPQGIGSRWCQAASTSSRRAWVLPALVIDPWERLAPLEFSVGSTRGRPRSWRR